MHHSWYRYFCHRLRLSCPFSFFFFNDTAPTEIYTLSLHDALPISKCPDKKRAPSRWRPQKPIGQDAATSREFETDRKSTRLNSSHMSISYAVFCLKKKKTTNKT